MKVHKWKDIEAERFSPQEIEDFVPRHWRSWWSRIFGRCAKRRG